MKSVNIIEAMPTSPETDTPAARIAAARGELLDALDTAIHAVHGGQATKRALMRRPITEPVWICAIGKAASAMALGALEIHEGSCVGGLVVTKPGHADPRQLVARGLQCLHGGHPLPDANSLEAGSRLIEAIDAVPNEARLLMLISGGASSLIEAPIQGVDLPELRRINAWLLGSGLPIGTINLVRKSISRIKGGGLLEFIAKRPVRALAISDVPGNAVNVIGSGLLAPEPDLKHEVMALPLPDWLLNWVRRGLAERDKIPTQGPEIALIADLGLAMKTAAENARQSGRTTWLHPELIVGDAATRGRELARKLLASEPGLHIWGGETTVELPASPGQGGRNQHLALAAAIELAGHGDCFLLSAGTDGTDGPTEDAGALVDGSTLERAADAGFDAESSLAKADSGTLLEASGDLIRTGPTGTNVMDLILGLKL